MREPDRLSPAHSAALRIEPNPPKGVLQLARPAAALQAAAPGTAVLRRGWQRLALTAGALSLLWGGLTGWDLASWVFGLPVVTAATALVFRFAPAPSWRLSLPGALRFALWFTLASARSGVDVAGRAFGWQVAVSPGFRSYRTSLPAGPARIFFANAISLLPGTLTAEIEGDRIEVHMLDTAADLAADLDHLETRVRRLFALPDARPDDLPASSSDAETPPARIEDQA